MWVVILDRSGSMGQPFAGAGSPDRGAIVVDVERKLQAAVEVVRDEIARLPREAEVALFAFNATCSLVFRGMAGESEAIKIALQSVVAAGLTDIADALDTAVRQSRVWDGPHGKHTVLLVTDGKSDPEAAKRATARAAAEHFETHVFLIDPTPEAEDLARDIVAISGGQWRPVLNRSQLEQAAGELGEAMRQEREVVAEFRRSVDETAKAAKAAVSTKEPVTLTAHHPRRVSRLHRYKLTVLVALQSEESRVSARLSDLTRALDLPTRMTEVGASLPNGTLLAIEPHIPGVFVNPARQEVLWRGRLEEATFDFEVVSTQSAPLTGFVHIFADQLPVADLPIAMEVEEEPSAADERVVVKAGTVERVFASYAHEDDRIVRSCQELYRGLGIALIVDRQQLLSGQRWKAVLDLVLAESDLFQLFWSEDASASSAVTDEWLLALELSPSKGGQFVRPVYWAEPMPTPPALLAPLHFHRLRLGDLPAMESSAAVEAGPTRQDIDVDFPVIALVDDGDQLAPVIQSALRRVVPFVQEVTGLRYQAPPTLIVDDHVMAVARAITHPISDLPPSKDAHIDDQDPDAVPAALALARSIALAFHVGGVGGFWPDEAGIYTQDNGRWLGLNTPLDIRAYEHVRAAAEGSFLGAVGDALGGGAPKSPANAQEALTQVELDRWSGWRSTLAAIVKETMEVADDDARSVLETGLGAHFLANLIEHPYEVRDDDASFLLSRLRQPNIAAIIEYYDTPFFTENGRPIDLWNERWLDAYAPEFFKRWKSYVQRLADLRAKGQIAVGFSTPVWALDWLQRQLPQLDMERTDHNWRNGPEEPEQTFKISMDGYLQTLDFVRDVLLGALARVRPPRVETATVAALSTTYGVYLNRRNTSALRSDATAAGWPPGALSASWPMVLVCASALARFSSDLRSRGIDEAAVAGRTEKWLAATLVHEHMHGCVETGLDRHSRAAYAGNDQSGWSKGNHLNEAIATWAQREWSHDDVAMTAAIDEYIAAGPYETWPYRGAETILRLFTDVGIGAVRSLVGQLRQVPEVAQLEFDQLVRTSPLAERPGRVTPAQ